MDTLATTATTVGGVDTLTILAQLILTVLIIPIVWLIRAKTKIPVIIDVEKIKAILLIATVWGLSRWVMPEMTVTEVIERALALGGITSMIYRTGGNKSIRRRLHP